ncbi:methyltransferase domain-containing protein [Caldiplasma sukawensis]
MSSINLVSFLKSTLNEKDYKKGWHKIGDAIIFPENFKNSLEIGDNIVKTGLAGQVYVKLEKIEGRERKPSLLLIGGNPHITYYKENGIYYAINPTKVMISKGNINERAYPTKKLEKITSILDLFSGIGYFTFPLLKKFSDAKATCVDINAEALKFLKLGAEKNGFAKRVSIKCQDARKYKGPDIYDLILMGNFKSMNYLHSAIKNSREGTMINLHVLSDTGGIQGLTDQIFLRFREMGALIDIMDFHKVKSYSPHMWHYSIIIEIIKLI